MKEPDPLPSSDAHTYLANLDSLIPVMPDARITISELSVEGTKFSYEWRFVGTFTKDVEWNGFIGRGQKIDYVSLAVGHASEKTLKMAEIRNYYSTLNVLRFFTHPHEHTSNNLISRQEDSSQAPTGPTIKMGLGQSSAKLKEACHSLLQKGREDMAITWMSKLTPYERPAPMSKIRGMQAVFKDAVEEHAAFLDLKLKINNVIVDPLSNRCTIEYFKSGRAVLGRHQLWGLELDVHKDAIDAQPPLVEWSGALSLLFDQDSSKVLLAKDFFDPMHPSEQMGCPLTENERIWRDKHHDEL